MKVLNTCYFQNAFYPILTLNTFRFFYQVVTVTRSCGLARGPPPLSAPAHDYFLLKNHCNLRCSVWTMLAFYFTLNLDGR